MHELVLNLMLGNTCHHEDTGNGEVVFTFDLHCMEIKVWAKNTNLEAFQNDEAEHLTYEIIKYEMRSI